MIPDLRLVGAQVLLPEGLQEAPLALSGGMIAQESSGREVDLSGFLVLPGMVDLHGDAFEKHLAPRRGAMKDIERGLVACEAELAANGIATACLAQFVSWEGGLRGPEFAEEVFGGVQAVRGRIGTDLRAQLRFEVSMAKTHGDAMLETVRRHAVGYVVFNDHLPHRRLKAGRRPAGLTSQALRAGRSPERHLDLVRSLHADMPAARAAAKPLAAALCGMGVAVGSHDDATAEARREWHEAGARIAEFPETREAAQAARELGDAIVLGAPNLVRGGSHKGNASALDLVAAGLCDALASDYHYPSLRGAALRIADEGVLDLAAAWALVSSGPARVLGLDDRGALRPGLRADLVILDARMRDVCATISGGRITFLRGEAAARFVG